jgi:hypothetical protein
MTNIFRPVSSNPLESHTWSGKPGAALICTARAAPFKQIRRARLAHRTGSPPRCVGKVGGCFRHWHPPTFPDYSTSEGHRCVEVGGAAGLSSEGRLAGHPPSTLTLSSGQACVLRGRGRSMYHDALKQLQAGRAYLLSRTCPTFGSAQHQIPPPAQHRRGLLPTRFVGSTHSAGGTVCQTKRPKAGGLVGASRDLHSAHSVVSSMRAQR